MTWKPSPEDYKVLRRLVSKIDFEDLVTRKVVFDLIGKPMREWPPCARGPWTWKGGYASAGISRNRTLYERGRMAFSFRKNSRPICWYKGKIINPARLLYYLFTGEWPRRIELPSFRPVNINPYMNRPEMIEQKAEPKVAEPNMLLVTIVIRQGWDYAMSLPEVTAMKDDVLEATRRFLNE